MDYSTLISTTELATHLGNERLVVFDCRHDLADPEAGRLDYEKSHIPSAQFLHLDHDLSGPTTGHNGRHPLPRPDVFALTLAKCGVDSSKQVVAYDASGGMFAARLWWMLRWLGHARVAVVDGGWQKWLREKRPVDQTAASIHATKLDPAPQASTVDARYIQAHLNQPDMCLIDARSPERFRGIGETLDRVGGHIPGARNRFFRDNLDVDGCFKSAKELKQSFTELIATTPITNVVHQCGSGVTACHNLLAMEIAAMSGAKLYPGSWSEWSSDRARPVESP